MSVNGIVFAGFVILAWAAFANYIREQHMDQR